MSSAPAAPAASASSAGPERRHIVVVVEENRSYDDVVGNSAAPFLASLMGSGTVLTHYFAIRHPSLPNYLALVAGDTFGISSDCTGCTVAAPNLATELTAAGVPWHAYLEGLPRPCSSAAESDRYAKKHDPLMYFPGLADSPAECDNVVPYSELARDAASKSLPAFALVVPNLVDDGHDAGLAAVDRWLRTFYDQLRSAPQWQTDDVRLVVTWDEGSDSDPAGCCGLAAGGHVLTVVAGPRVPRGTDDAEYTHYSVLKSVEQVFGVPLLGHAADSRVRAIPAITSPSP